MSAGRVQGGLRGLPVLPSGGRDRSGHSASRPRGTSLRGQHHWGRRETRETFPVSSVSVAAKLGPPWPRQHPALLPRPGTQARPAALGHFCPHFTRHQAGTRAGPWSRAPQQCATHTHGQLSNRCVCLLARSPPVLEGAGRAQGAGRVAPSRPEGEPVAAPLGFPAAVFSLCLHAAPPLPDPCPHLSFQAHLSRGTELTLMTSLLPLQTPQLQVRSPSEISGPELQRRRKGDTIQPITQPAGLFQGTGSTTGVYGRN